MEASAIHTPGQPGWAEHFSEALHLQRDRVREFLAAQQERLKRAEAQLTAQLQLLADELARNRDETRQARAEIERRSEQLAQQIAMLEGLRKEFDARQTEWQQLQQRTTQQQEALVAQVRQQQEELDRRQDELAGRREELTAAEAQIHKDQRALELARSEYAAECEQLAALRKRVEAKQAELDALEQQFAARQAEWEHRSLLAGRQRDALAEQLREQQASLEAREKTQVQRCAELDAGEAQLHDDRRAAEQALREQAPDREQLAALRAKLGAQQTELHAKGEEVSARQSETEAQRRRIARELKAQRAAQQKEMQRARAELERRDRDEINALQRELHAVQRLDGQRAAELESLRSRHEQLLEQLRAQPRDDVHARLGDLQAERDGLVERLSATERRLSDTAGRVAEAAERLAASEQRARQIEHRLADAVQKLAESEGRVQQAEQRLAESGAQLAETSRRLAEAEKRLAESPAAKTADGAEDFRRRYEMALDDLRELKARNAELQQQLAKAQLGRPAAVVAPSPGGKLDWEAEKRRILAELETDTDEEPAEEERAGRIKLDEVIRRTDAVIAEKDREIAELKQILENQSSNLGSVAVGAAALGQMLDQDAVIREERENLKRLQEEWQQKLRQAEIEISLERAKIARERSQTDERLRALESQGGQGSEKPAATGEKPARGRWLSRLGLKDDDSRKR